MLKRHRTRSLCAASAIAMLALGSAPAIAQETAPVIDLPASAGAPEPPSAPVVQPTIVLPDVSEPADQPRETVAPAPAPVRATRQEPARAAAREAQSDRPAPVPATPTEPEAATPVAAPLVPPPVNSGAEPAALPAPEAQPAPAVERGSGLGAEAGLVALLAALGLGGAGLMAARLRRRRPVVADEDAAAMEPVAAVPVMPVAAGPAPAAYAMHDPRPMPEPIPTHVDIPAGAIPRGEERDALLRRMVAAAPDEANPFRSRKARLRRARLILQRLDHERQVSNQDAGFDWRTYQQPGRAPAPAEQVDA